MIREWHHSILVRDRRTGLDDDASKKMLGHVIRENRAKEKIKSNVPGEWKAGSCACTCLDATACIKLSRKNEGRNVVAHILVTIYKRRLLRQIPRSPRLAPLSLARSLANLSLSLSLHSFHAPTLPLEMDRWSLTRETSKKRSEKNVSSNFFVNKHTPGQALLRVLVSTYFWES